jgi:Cu-Zn family superoxide dismutase
MYKKNLNEAYAIIKGGESYPQVSGTVNFSQMSNGVLVTAKINGLPNQSTCCRCGVFGFHIHEGISCSGNEEDEFADAKGHYNPNGCPHPYHAGDLPALFGNNGYAYMSVLTSRFYLDEIIGKTVIVHLDPDDYHTQPSGNSGEKIACGIVKYR